MSVTGNSDGSQTRNPNSLANLKPWKPGQSGNRRGRPKTPISDELRRLLRRKIPNTELSYAKAMALAIVQAAIRGDGSMAKLVTDRIEGKVMQPVDLSGQVQVVIDL